MADKKITTVDTIDTLPEDGSVFVSDGTNIMQISKQNAKKTLGIDELNKTLNGYAIKNNASGTSINLVDSADAPIKKMIVTPTEESVTSVDVTVCNKNFLDITELFPDYKFDDDDSIKNGSYSRFPINQQADFFAVAPFTFSGNISCTSNTVTNRVIIYFVHTDGTSTQISWDTDEMKANTRKSLLITKDINAIYLSFGDGKGVITYSNFMISYDTDTTYERKMSQTATIDTETQTGWESLRTYKTITNITPTQSANIDIEYVEDTESYVDAKVEALNETLDAKVDKVDGKALSTNDYTNEDKEKLASLNNYDDTEVKQEISNVNETIANDYAHAIKPTANGTSINLADSADAPIQNMEVHGNNLYNIDKDLSSITNRGATITKIDDYLVLNGVSTTDRNSGWFCYYFENKVMEEDGVYYFKLTDITNLRAYIKVNNTLYWFDTYVGKSVTIKKGDILTLGFTSYENGTVFDNQKIYFMMSKSDIPYEPYTKDIDVTVCGKNYISSFTTKSQTWQCVDGVWTANNNNYESLSSNPFYLKAGETYTFNVDVITNNNKYFVKAVTYPKTTTEISLDFKNKSFTPTVSGLYTIYVYGISSSSGAFSLKNVQLELGSSATEYEDGKETQTATIDTETQIGWEDLKTYYPVTNIIPTQPATIDVDYVADTKNYIDNKLMALTALTLEG